MSIDLRPYAQLLVCPACRSKLVVDGPSFVCRSQSCRLRYDVKDDIPVMLADEARAVPMDEWSTLIKKTCENS